MAIQRNLVRGQRSAWGHSTAVLAGLELGADKSDIERLPIRLNEEFVGTRLNYTAMVEASHGQFLFVTPKLAASQGATITIIGTAARDGNAEW